MESRKKTLNSPLKILNSKGLPLDLLGVGLAEAVGYANLTRANALAWLDAEHILRLARLRILGSGTLEVAELLGVNLHILRVELCKMLEFANLCAILPPLDS